jgi:hypothetical protein
VPLAPAVGDCPSIEDGARYRQSASWHACRHDRPAGNLPVSLARTEPIRNSMQLRDVTVSRL